MAKARQIAAILECDDESDHETPVEEYSCVDHEPKRPAHASRLVQPTGSADWFLSDEGPMLETLDYTIRIGSTPTILYFDFYLYSAYAAHYV